MRALGMAAILVASAAGIHAQQGPLIFSGAGANPEALQAAVGAYRTLLGTNNAVGPPNAAGGRREINWDGVGDAVAAPNNLPADQFRNRGAVFSAESPAWSGFQVSANDGVAPVRFGNLNPQYSSLFTVFSAQRLFTALGDNVFDVEFFVPGTQTRATVNAFGAVFTNVALNFTSSIEYFNADGYSLGKFYAQTAPRGLSFLGAAFAAPIVGRVRITQGTVVPGANEDLPAGRNAVVVDDFIYGEPVNRCGCTPP